MGKGREGKGKGREQEGECRGETNKKTAIAKSDSNIVESKIRPLTKSQKIETIFAYWKKCLNHPRAALDDKRKKIITKALVFHDVQQLCNAITGCSMTAFNMGANENGQRYDDIGLILRDQEHIDRFIRNFEHPPKPMTKTDQLNQQNAKSIGEWIGDMRTVEGECS